MQQLPAEWASRRCRLVEAAEEDIGAVADVYEDNRDTLLLTGPEGDPQRIAAAIVRHEDLPPDGDPQRETTWLVRLEASADSAGVLAVYSGHPAERTLYIGELFLRKTVQGLGLGNEIVAALEDLARTTGHHEIRLAVALKNWPALRFWIGRGYERITKISGDGRHAEDAFANIELGKVLDP